MITCIWYTTTCLVPHHPYLGPHNPCLVPHHPCLVPHLCLVFHHMTGIPPLSGTPPCVWNPIPSPVLYCTPVPHPHHLTHSTPPPLAIAASIWPLTTPCPLIWPLPSHHFELLPHATPTTSSNCHLALMHPPIPLSWPSGPPCPTVPAPSDSLSSASCPTTPAIWPSYPITPSICHLALLPLPSPPSPAIWHSWPQLPVPSGSLPLLLLPTLPPTQSGRPAPTPPNIITEGPLHPKRKFEFFRVSKFSDVCFNLTSHEINLISSENNIFHLTWKNSQNSREATLFPSIRYLYKSPMKTCPQTDQTNCSFGPTYLFHLLSKTTDSPECKHFR